MPISIRRSTNGTEVILVDESSDSETTLKKMLIMGEQLIESLVPVVILQHGRKKPMKNDDGSWLTIDDYLRFHDTLKSLGKAPNLGVLLHPRQGSGLICLDIDGITPQVRRTLDSLGVSKAGQTWQQRTGKGNYHVFYRWPGEPLPRIIRADGQPIDLLTNGYALVSPSNTHLEPGGGGSYRWVPGHSPFDISMSELEVTPELLVEWWQTLSSKKAQPDLPGTTPRRKEAWHLLKKPITEGSRNQSLTRLAGWLRQYFQQEVTLELVGSINQGRCVPPLAIDEVESIVRSVYRYPQRGVSGHPKAIVNPFKETSPS